MLNLNNTADKDILDNNLPPTVGENLEGGPNMGMMVLHLLLALMCS